MKLTKLQILLIALIVIVSICLFIKNRRAAARIGSPESSYRKPTNAQLIADCYKRDGDPILTLGGLYLGCD